MGDYRQGLGSHGRFGGCGQGVAVENSSASAVNKFCKVTDNVCEAMDSICMAADKVWEVMAKKSAATDMVGGGHIQGEGRQCLQGHGDHFAGWVQGWC